MTVTREGTRRRTRRSDPSRGRARGRRQRRRRSRSATRTPDQGLSPHPIHRAGRGAQRSGIGSGDRAGPHRHHRRPGHRGTRRGAFRRRPGRPDRHRHRSIPPRHPHHGAVEFPTDDLGRDGRRHRSAQCPRRPPAQPAGRDRRHRERDVVAAQRPWRPVLPSPRRTVPRPPRHAGGAPTGDHARPDPHHRVPARSSTGTRIRSGSSSDGPR